MDNERLRYTDFKLTGVWRRSLICCIQDYMTEWLVVLYWHCVIWFTSSEVKVLDVQNIIFHDHTKIWDNYLTETGTSEHYKSGVYWRTVVCLYHHEHPVNALTCTWYSRIYWTSHSWFWFSLYMERSQCQSHVDPSRTHTNSHLHFSFPHH